MILHSLYIETVISKTTDMSGWPGNFVSGIDVSETYTYVFRILPQRSRISELHISYKVFGK
jgi:hypothetical protein